MYFRKTFFLQLAIMFALSTICTTLFAGDPSEKVVRFGAPLPLTGPLSPEGKKAKDGYDLWAEVANKAGGIKVGDARYRVEICYYDYQTNTPRAVQLAEKLVTDDKVNFLFSPFGSGAGRLEVPCQRSTVSQPLPQQLLRKQYITRGTSTSSVSIHLTPP